MLITNIDRQKHTPHRVNIYLDGEFAFGIELEVLATLGLKKGDNLSREAVEQVLHREERALARSTALRSLAARRRTEKELRDKLLEKEFTPLTVDAVIADLREHGYINDAEFAKAFIHDAQLRKPTGRALLRRKLWLKGIGTEIIDTALGEEISDQDEEQRALAAGEKLFKRAAGSRKPVDEAKQKQRLIQQLGRRGFSWSTISPVIKKIFSSDRRGAAV